MMKTSLFGGFSGYLDTLGLEEGVRFVKSFGVDGGEMFPCKSVDTIEAARDLREILKAEGMTCPCFSVCIDLSEKDETNAMNAIRHYIDLAAEIGAPYIHHTLIPSLHHPHFGAPTFDEVFDEVVRRAQIICDYAADKGITCLYEDQGYYFNGADRFERYLTALKRENTGVCADFGNIYFVDEEPADFIGRFTGVIHHVHVKDYLRKVGTWPGEGWYMSRGGAWLRDTTIGHGVIDFEKSLRILASIGYDGYFSLESGSPEEFVESNRRGLANLKRFYENAVRDTRNIKGI